MMSWSCRFSGAGSGQKGVSQLAV